jgi:hypothetical protein
MLYTLSTDIKRKIQEAVKKRKKLGEETKQRIFLLIAESEPQGMTTNELVKATGRNRRTVHGICRYYQEKRLIEKTGRYGKYHLSSKAKQIDEPSIGSLIVQLHMLRTKLFGLGEIAFASSMGFCDVAYPQHIFNEYKKDPANIKQKEAVEKFILFEFALRWGASILYLLIQSMRYAHPSLHINESMRNQLITRRLETAVNPFLLRSTFELLLLILEKSLGKEQESEQKDTRNLSLKLMGERFEEMENTYKKTFPTVFEAIEKLQHDMVYEPGLLEVQRSEQEDPDHTKCEGELMPRIHVDSDGRKVKRCGRCKRWIPVEDPKL